MWLRVLTGAGAGRVVRIAGERFLVGSDRSCGLVLRDGEVEPRHAVLVAVPGGYRIEDLGTRSGTFVNGRRIRHPVELHGGERLCFGDTFIDVAAAQVASSRQRRRLVAVGAVGAGLVVAGAALAIAGVLGGGDGPPVAAAPEPLAQPAELTPAAGPATETAAATPAAGPDEPALASTAAEAAAPAAIVEHFSDPGSGFETFDDEGATAAYVGGRLAVRVKSSTFYATAVGPRAVRAPTVRVTALNPSRTENAGFGIVCAYRDQGAFLAATVGANGTYALLEARAGVLTVLSGNGQWVSHRAIRPGARRYELEASCGGGELRLAVDGEQVASAAARAPRGRAGVFVAGPAEIRFDDLVIRPGGARS
ncbi:MAG: FHA domain-containing protein [Thermoleophilia bacterium]|nr:FHA domain-containing protein [Thermoleophilia bacterium]